MASLLVLHIMLSWVGTQIIPIENPGYCLNCVSNFFAAVAAYFHFSAVLRWHLGLVKLDSKGNGGELLTLDGLRFAGPCNYRRFPPFLHQPFIQ